MNEKRTEKIVVRITASEKNYIYRLAEESGMHVSEYVRKKCLESDIPIINKNKSLEYVQLIHAIENIEEDETRLEVSHRLEVLLCHLSK